MSKLHHLIVAVMLLNIPIASAYDLALLGGRVIDPQSGRDEITNIAIDMGRVVAIGPENFKAATSLDVSGLVVSPGFIDLHSHAQTLAGQTYQVMDGVTTALDLEIGNAYGLTEQDRAHKSLINYGYSASHWRIRHQLKGDIAARAFHEPLSNPELMQLLLAIEQQILDGAMGIGLGLDYFSKGVSHAELLGLFQLAAKYQQPIYIHTRVPDSIDDLSGITELLEMARKTQAPLHVVHVTSTALKRTASFLKLIDQARAEGLDITTEVYPYTAGSTGIGFGIFDHNWQAKLGISYGDIEWANSGERFKDQHMWQHYRSKHHQEQVILHMIDETWVKMALRHPSVIVASDAMPIQTLKQRVHPRGMGSFSRVISRYVRDEKTLSLAEALNKMTYLPAKRLQAFAPNMRRKGRINLGSDADITIFDMEAIRDSATFSEPNQFPNGIKHVLVGGEFVVRDSALQSNRWPGQRITSSHTTDTSD